MIAKEFIEKLNVLTGENFRLPTEAEWEYAACGGNKSKNYAYPGSDNVGDVAWYSGNSNSTTHEVKGKLPNELGLYDMGGNVWEWCSDWYGRYSAGAVTNPQGPTSGSARIYRVVAGSTTQTFVAACTAIAVRRQARATLWACALFCHRIRKFRLPPRLPVPPIRN